MKPKNSFSASAFANRDSSAKGLLTSVSLKRETKERLNRYGAQNASYDELLNKLMDRMPLRKWKWEQ